MLSAVRDQDMPGDDGLLAILDPESVADTPPERLLTVPRATLGIHAAVAALLVGFGAVAATGGQLVQAVIVGGIGGMILVAGWAGGRIAARR
jgi:hypothetical protein